MSPKDRRFAPPPLAPICKPAVHAPPPVAQMKVMPGTVATWGAVPPPTRYGQVSSLQRKVAAAPGGGEGLRPGAGPGTPCPGQVAQPMKSGNGQKLIGPSKIIKKHRKKFEQSFNYAVVPGKSKPEPFVNETMKKIMERRGLKYVPEVQKDPYVEHVALRVRHCAMVMMKVLKFYNWASGQGVVKNWSNIFSKKAEVQVSDGIYTDTYKVDAAHLMNISVRPTELESGMLLTPDQKKATGDLERISGATTMQYKANNVGPDKVIDTTMTQFIEVFNATWVGSSNFPTASAVVSKLSDMCIANLSQSSKSGNENYQQAIAGVKDAKAKVNWAIDFDVGMWAFQYGFG